MMLAKQQAINARVFGARQQPARGVLQVRRYKEDEREQELELRRRMEEVRRRQEAGIQDKDQLPKFDTDRVKDSLKQNVAEPIKSTLQEAAQKPDYDIGAPKVSWWTTAFTRRREIFAGRLAMVGFTAACFWELVFPGHPNIMEQVAGAGQLAGLPITTPMVASFFGVLILHNALASLLPGSATWSPANLADVAKRPVGPPGTFVNPLNLKQFFGISGWGFTKANELFHGRLAMVGFLAALINQVRIGGYSGPGPLAQVAYFMGTPSEDLYAAVPSLFMFWSVFAITLAFINGRPGPQSLEGEKEIY